jgi:hypothetical protein
VASFVPELKVCRGGIHHQAVFFPAYELDSDAIGPGTWLLCVTPVLAYLTPDSRSSSSTVVRDPRCVHRRWVAIAVEFAGLGKGHRGHGLLAEREGSRWVLGLHAVRDGTLRRGPWVIGTVGRREVDNVCWPLDRASTTSINQRAKICVCR